MNNVSKAHIAVAVEIAIGVTIVAVAVAVALCAKVAAVNDNITAARIKNFVICFIFV